MEKHKPITNPFNIVVIVAALGYFVDIYDLILFGIVRIPSLTDLGLTPVQIEHVGIQLINMQMIGMVVGGVLWGMLGDKKGRLSVLFMTIIIYSLANILNGLVTSIWQYYVLRFVAGLGLAGELGIGITLVSEVMSQKSRGFGTTIVAGVGVAGAVAGFLVADLFSWRMAYFVGGGLGLALLLLRVSVFESGMYTKVKDSSARRGSFISILTNRARLIKYIKCILVGTPVWYVIGILVFLAPEFAKELGVVGNVTGGKSIMYHYIGASTGAFLTGLLSQWLGSRKKALLAALFSLAIMVGFVLMARGTEANNFYMLLLLLGIPNGFWSVFITTSSEQFGTNLRATVTTSAPNIVRGMTVVITSLFTLLTSFEWSRVAAASVIGFVVIGLAILSTIKLEESFHKDLDYLEKD